MVTLGSSARKVNDDRYYCYYYVHDSHHQFVKVALFLAKPRFINLSHEQRVDRCGLHARVAQCGEYYAHCDWLFPKIYLTNTFHDAVRLLSNRSQMTSKCGKNKVVAHESQASLSLMFLPHFDVLCDLILNRPMATWRLFYTMIRREKSPIHKPASYRLTVRRFVLIQAFLSPKGYISSLLFPFFILLVYSFFKKFFNVFSCSKQNNGENILQNSESLVAIRHNGNCCEDFLQFRYS